MKRRYFVDKRIGIVGVIDSTKSQMQNCFSSYPGASRILVLHGKYKDGWDLSSYKVFVCRIIAYTLNVITNILGRLK